MFERIKEDVEHYEGYLIIFFICLCLAGAWHTYRTTSETNVSLKDKLSLVEISLQEIEVTKAREQTLMRLLDEAKKENNTLLQLIASTKAPATIRETVTQEILIPGDIVYLDTPPTSHLFTLKNGIVVASIKDREYITHDLEFKNNIVISDYEILSSLQGRSSYKDEWVEIDHYTEVTHVANDRHKLLKLNAGIGASYDFLKGYVAPQVFVSTIHPHKNIDVANVYVKANESHFDIGIQPVALNLRSILPIVENTWVAPGVNINVFQQPGIDLSIGVKF